MEIAPLLDPVVQLTRAVGQAILPLYEGAEADLDVQVKSDNTPVTAADLLAHDQLVAGLKKLTPTIPILSEEESNMPFEKRKDWSYFWLLDPIDGTKEFLHHTHEFTVNVALVNGHEPLLGVVYAPVFEKIYYGMKGEGAFRVEGNGVPESIHTRQADPEQLRVLTSRRHRAPVLDKFLQGLPSCDPLPMGSSLKFCVLAEGEGDLYPCLGKTSEWDTAAAQVVLEAAGGAIWNASPKKVAEVGLRPLIYNTKEHWLNPPFLAVGDPSLDWKKYF